ncbi:MAG TPA: PEGA domain-containing protein [Labilithrix sp.]|jgi:hypothetical protein|nr:PEGA domain-containing protein [Labilithrix sp.]
MRHGLLIRATLGLTLLLGTTSSVALAADPSPQDIAQARELGHQAQVAFDAGRLAESEKLWTGASNLYPAAATLTLGLARTQAKLGKLVLAQESYNKIIREQSQNPNPPPAFKAALEAANAEIGAVSSKIAGVVITVEGAPNPTVTIDGQPVSSAGLGLRRPVDPGAHVIKAEAPGYKPAETSFQVAESATAEAKLRLEKAAASAVAAAPAEAATPAAGNDAKPAELSTSKSPKKTLAIVAFGVGGAGLVLGAVTGVLALGKHGDLEGQCPNGKCPNDVSGDVDSYKTMGLLSTVGFIVGGVGLAAGAVLWFTAPKETATTGGYKTVTRTAGSGFTWQPYVGAGGGGFTGRF